MQEAPLRTLDDAIIERTAQRFARAAAHRSTYYYVSMKLRGDPATRAIASLGPLGDVLDIGCGRGHLALFLLESGLARRVRAYDWDTKKIELARRAAEGLNASFGAQDARGTEAHEAADTVLLVDVLHYLSPAAQDDLLLRASERVRPGGRLVVRDATRGRGWRSVLTMLVERLSKLVRLNLGDEISIRDVSRDYVPLLEGRGMTCTVTPCWQGTPFANVLLVASKPG